MKINRRTFLKATAVVTIGIPTLPAIAKPKLQWISLSEQMPKTGQRILQVSPWIFRSSWDNKPLAIKHIIRVGKRIRFNVDDNLHLRLRMEFAITMDTHSWDRHNVLYYYKDFSERTRPEICKELDKIEWTKYKEVREREYGITSLMANDGHYWMHIEDKIPTSITQFTKEP